MSTFERFWLGAIVVGLFVIVFAWGLELGRSTEHALAIKAGVGRWVADERTGETRFYYGGMGDGR